MLFIFAGPVISNTDYYLILAVAFVVISAFLAAILYFLKRVLYKNNSSAKKLSIKKSFFITTSAIVVGILVFLVVPTVISDYRWDEKQSECANKAGYSSPSDNNNLQIATASTQSAYRSCLDK